MATQPSRLYAHGDQDEHHLDSYYCAWCDVFSAKDHFTDDHSHSNNFEHYQYTLKHVKLAVQNGKASRPEGAPNVFVFASKQGNKQ